MFCRNLGVSFWGEHDLNSLLEILCSVKTLVYPFELSMISGARYQRVATYSVKKPVWSWSGSCFSKGDVVSEMMMGWSSYVEDNGFHHIFGFTNKQTKTWTRTYSMKRWVKDLQQLVQGRSHRSSGHKWCSAINCLVSGLCKQLLILLFVMI